VAVKVQRPGIKSLVEKDFSLLRSFASFAESIPSFDLHKKNGNGDSNDNGNGDSNSNLSVVEAKNGDNKSNRLINTELVSAVDEFMSRIFEELDYTNEAANAKTFAQLYSKKNGSSIKSLPNGQGVIVPEIISSLCTKNVIVMEWIEGSKLTSINNGDSDSNDMANTDGQIGTLTASTSSVNNKDLELQENIALVEQALYVTLSQLLDTGVMHADPHGGNLLKVSQSSSLASSEDSIPTLAYLDFGLLATIPATVRDGLVCAVASLVFAKDVEAVANLFGELDLLPAEVISDPIERKALTEALTKTMEEVLKYPQGETLFSNTSSSSSSIISLSSLGRRISSYKNKREETTIPSLQFDKLLDGLTRLVPRFKFRLPPYFINNARALGTLEGIARSLDSDFNCLKLMYPYALYRLLQNPTGSPVVEATLQNLIRSKETGRVDREKVSKLLRDTAMFTGFSRRKVLMDILKTKGGKRLMMHSLASELNHILLRRIIQKTKRFASGGKKSFLKL
jgi:predicted unusual protein kinase regulating ubiquinone biosynthesis (AarF/ABC1/UbiB family)